MSLPRYSSYKDSGVEWLGEVPSHWSSAKFRHCFRESGEKIEAEIVGEMLSVSGYRGIEVRQYDDDNQRRTDEDLVGYRIVRVGQLVVNTMWLNYAGLGVSKFEGHVSPAYRSYWINEDLDKHYIHHLMRSDRYVKGYTQLLTGIRPNSLQMSREDLMNFPVLIPPRDEQAAIAAFLDRETGKIDALVTEQERLIALLTEKRQAVISHAVTKGLNPTAPMKPSGIDWLGDIPAHWEVKPLKTIATCNNEVLEETTEPDYEIEYVEISDVSASSGITSSSTINFTNAPSRARRRVKNGDVIVSTVRTYLRAIAAINDPPHNMVVSTGFAVIRPRSVQSVFVGYAFQAEFLISDIISRSTGISYPAINASEIMQLKLPLPPSDEQSAIGDFLDQETSKIDDLIVEAEKAITILQERRTALISAAVTGKIDVRGQARKEQAA